MKIGNSDDNAAAVRLRVPDRGQAVMKVQAPDELVGAAHRIRVVWRVVESMDLWSFCKPIKARQGVRGRDATDPRLLVALWLYATIRGVGSARELARLCLESRPFMWLCGGVSINHHLLSDFRVDHAAALDGLFTRVIAALVDKDLVKVTRISQDGTRVRACAGASSFRRKERLEELLEQARAHVVEVKALLDDPARSAGLSARKKAAGQRAARERLQRVEEAVAALPELEKKQKKLAKKVSRKQKAAQRIKEPRASTTDSESRVMKMPNGGFNPAVNMQFAVDIQSRAVVGVEVVAQGTDQHLAEPMRRQVEQRTGRKVKEHLIDGGYLVKDEVERAAAQDVRLYVPPKPPRNKDKRGSQYEPMPGESQTLTDWRARMGSDKGKEIYKERAATSETVNGDFKTHRGLDRLRVRGLAKATCVGLWLALAYNVMHFAAALGG
jgi:transposase